MASNKITRDQIIDDKAIQWGVEYAVNVKKASEAMQDILKYALEFQKLSKDFNNVKNETEYVETKKRQKKAITEGTIALQENEKVNKRILVLQQKLKVAEASKNKEIIKSSGALNRANAELRKQDKIANAINKTYEKLNYEYAKLNKLAQEAGANFGTQSVQFKKASRAALKYRKRIDEIDRTLKNSQKNVGNYSSALRGVGKLMRNLVGALGITAGFTALFRILGDVFTRIREFDKVMQNLAGILGTTRSKLKGLEEEIINVAGSSVKTSNEVAKLAETLVVLGKTKKEVIQLLEPVNNLSIGLEATSQEAGEFLIQTLNAFGQSADSAQEYADILAKIRTTTALNFQKMRDSMSYLAPIANTLNLSLADTGAILGTLNDNAIKAERAGRLMGTSFIKLATAGLTLDDALDKINEAQEKQLSSLELLAVAEKLFGKQSAALGLILADNRDKTQAYTEAFDDAGGSLKKLINEQLKSLNAKLKGLDSAAEEFVLTVESGDGAIAKTFKNLIGFITLSIKRLTALEKVQSQVFNATGKSKGWLDYLKKVSILTTFIKTDYDELLEKQKEFNTELSGASGQSIDNLRARYGELNVGILLNNDLSDDQKKLYKQQADLIYEIINSKEIERKALEDTARELKWNGDLYLKNGQIIKGFSADIKNHTDNDLKRYIAAVKAVNEAEIDDKKPPIGGGADGSQLEKDKLDLQQFHLEQQALTLEKEIDNEEVAALRKLEIAKDLFSKREEIAAVQLEKSLIGVKEGTDKEMLIIEKYFATLLSLEEKFEEDKFKIAQDNGKNLQRVLKVALDQNKITQNNEETQLRRSLNKRHASEKETEEAITNLKRKHSRENAEIVINELEKILQASSLTAEARLAIEVKLSDARKDLEKDSATVTIEQEKITAELILEIASELGYALQDLGNALFEGKIQKIDEEIQRNDEKYTKLIEAASNDKKQQELLEKEKEKNRVKLEDKKRKEQVKQAKFNKGMALMQATINTAIAITAALNTNPFLPLGPIMAVLAGVLGTIQIAAIAATPIPKFKTGTKAPLSRDTLAITGDGGKHEPITKSGKLIGVSPNTATYTYLPKGAEVHKDWDSLLKTYDTDEIMQKANNASILSSLQFDKKQISEYSKTQSFNLNFDKQFSNMSSGIRREVRDGFKRMNINVNNNNSFDFEAYRNSRLN